jgi:hypothetical protein
MDSNQYISGGVGASIVIALIILKQVYNTINHKRIRSRCCGTDLEASVDIEETTPKDAKDDVKVKVENVTHMLSGIDKSSSNGER